MGKTTPKHRPGRKRERGQRIVVRWRSSILGEKRVCLAVGKKSTPGATLLVNDRRQSIKTASRRQERKSPTIGEGSDDVRK